MSDLVAGSMASALTRDSTFFHVQVHVHVHVPLLFPLATLCDSALLLPRMLLVWLSHLAFSCLAIGQSTLY